jgi:hypothetical protein
MIYFIQCLDSTGVLGPVKIGLTGNSDQALRKRVKDLQTGSPHPLRVLAVLRGGLRTESLLHSRFRESRVRGEWFALDPGLISLIRYLREIDLIGRKGYEREDDYDHGGPR